MYNYVQQYYKKNINVCIFCANDLKVKSKTKKLIESLYSNYNINYITTGPYNSGYSDKPQCDVELLTNNFKEEFQECIGNNKIDVYIFENCPFNLYDWKFVDWNSTIEIMKSNGTKNAKVIFGIFGENANIDSFLKNFTKTYKFEFKVSIDPDAKIYKKAYIANLN